ncbi:MAG: HIT family protein [Planctomycetes bacterium]|nr:HIT family protein [Planctomycetota bacterium]
MKDKDCIFCKIAAGEIPCSKILEDDSAIAFLDIGPLAKGHTLLIPKDHYVTVDEMPPELAGAVLKHLPTLVKAVKSATNCEGVNILQNNGRVAHQVIPHVHFHIIPRRAGDEFHFNWPAGSYSEGEIEQLAQKIRENLSVI